MNPLTSPLLGLYKACAVFRYLSVRWHTQASRKENMSIA
jgi:hypothetical protein